MSARVTVSTNLDNVQMKERWQEMGVTVRKQRKQRQRVDVGWLQLNEEYLHSALTVIQMFQSDKPSDADMTSLVIQQLPISDQTFSAVSNSPTTNEMCIPCWIRTPESD